MEKEQIYKYLDSIFFKVTEIYLITTPNNQVNRFVKDSTKAKSKLFLMKFIKEVKKYGMEKEYNTDLLLRDLEEIF